MRSAHMGRRIGLLEQSGKPHWPTTEAILDISAQHDWHLKLQYKVGVNVFLVSDTIQLHGRKPVCIINIYIQPKITAKCVGR